MFTNPAFDNEDREMLHSLMENRSIRLSESAQGAAVFTGTVLAECDVDLEIRNQFVKEQFHAACPYASKSTLNEFMTVVDRAQRGLISEEDTAYQKFFKATLKKFGASSPADFKSDAEKKKFFDYIAKNWKGKQEESQEDNDESDDEKLDEKKRLGEASKPVGFIVMYSGKKMEIPFSKHPNISMSAAKEMAIKQWKVPKSKQGLVAIAPGYDESLSEAEDIEMWKRSAQRIAKKWNKTMVLVRNKVGGKLDLYSKDEFKQKSKDQFYIDNKFNPAGAKVLFTFKP